MAKQDTSTANQWYTSHFKNREERLNGLNSPLISDIRKNAIAKLEKVHFPGRKNEDWKYTNLNKFLKTQYRESDQYHFTRSSHDSSAQYNNAFYIRFCNGQLDFGNSDIDALKLEADFMTVAEALEDPEFSTEIESQLGAVINAETSAFTVMNVAFAKQGFVLRLKKNTSLSKPVFLEYDTHADDHTMITQQCIVLADAGSKASIIEMVTHQNALTSSFRNGYSRYIIAENANVTHYTYQDENPMSTQIQTTEVWQDRSSTFTSFRIDNGGKLVRNNLYVTHLGVDITTNLYGVYLASGNQHIDNQTFIDHAFPHCQSNELYKGILDHNSRAVFNGKVIVRPDAQKTNAFQQNNNLILSEHAAVDTKPQLEIFADDVRCSHGATVGQLDAQSMYYLKSRGLTETQAKSMLKIAFLQDVFTRLENDPVIDFLQSRMMNMISAEQPMI